MRYYLVFFQKDSRFTQKIFPLKYQTEILKKKTKWNRIRLECDLKA